jgi:hypothetical protein
MKIGLQRVERLVTYHLARNLIKIIDRLVFVCVSGEVRSAVLNIIWTKFGLQRVERLATYHLPRNLIMLFPEPEQIA